MMGSATPSYANDYTAGYFTPSQSTATKVFIGTDFSGTNPSVIPTWILSIASVAGTSSSGQCPCTYQQSYNLYPTGQVSILVETFPWMQNPTRVEIANVGTTSSFALEGLVKYDSSIGKVKFVNFVYNTHTQFDNNAPTIYNPLSSATGDTNFYVGTTTVNGKTVERFQFGVESPTNITSSSWHVDQNSLESYSGTTWSYVAASSIEGNRDIITFLGSAAAVVGGRAMLGVNLNTGLSSTDSPSWEYTGTSIGDGTSLWTGSGSPVPYACQVSGRC
ncbi:MAG: hypothetical protein HY247_04355 [archaeon]|nr:MAG: hypothetical protein HY247_04355 [archaeon]